ncbi:NAD-dependent epimerase/dehydratase family protein [Salsipaludibacter albus]|uniref:NAD-dependent epimerase/dehydratase family protein n=1 Tax=Salsipaludibacter albus TaxID=2849650 RepID=UPI001EE4466D|nr:NAD-dependent epimerase/dehydratase family protein [Salsipaludibacter albus]
MADTVMVTGGAGFVGSTLVDRMLAEERRVVVVDDLSSGRLANLDTARREHAGQLDFQRLDVTSDALGPFIGRHRPEVVYHLAARGPGPRSVADPVGDARVNLLGTVNLLQGAVDHGVRKVVFASSGSGLHGRLDPDDLPATETSPTVPTSPYGAAKLSAEHYLGVFALLHDLEWTSLAIADVYGPRQSGTGEGGIVTAMAEAMLADHDVTIHGDGEQTRDFVFVDDVVHAMALAADRGHGRRYNIGTAQQTSLNQLFRALAAATRFTHRPTRLPEQPGDVAHTALSGRRAAEDLGWKPWTTLEEGLATTLEWLASRRGS